MMGFVDSKRARDAVPLLAVTADTLRKTITALSAHTRRWVDAAGYRAEPGSFCLVPDAKGKLQCVLVGVSHAHDCYALATLPLALPPGQYQLSEKGLALNRAQAALGWGLGAYQFTRYRKPKRPAAELVLNKSEPSELQSLLNAVYRVRDLVNTPTEDLGPAELAATVKELSVAHKATYRHWIGDQLLKANFPAIHAVGRASHRAPRLVELNWGNKNHPHLAIVGKGVCFDTGGLDMKSSDGMRWMKKDMGGAAHAIALADLIMQAKLPVRLTLLIPAVENAISANAYRPGEVLRTRAGVTVEVDNTDAEGRLVLCDAMSYAIEGKLDLLIDFATLTGAARVALGPDLPALFCNRDDLSADLLQVSKNVQDPLWPMPLWQPYQSMLESTIADISNCGSSRHAGTITAALYLQRFVPDSVPWCHVDIYAWNDSAKPGRPKGGEAQSLRAFFAFLQNRYASA